MRLIKRFGTKIIFLTGRLPRNFWMAGCRRAFYFNPCSDMSLDTVTVSRIFPLIWMAITWVSSWIRVSSAFGHGCCMMDWRWPNCCHSSSAKWGIKGWISCANTSNPSCKSLLVILSLKAFTNSYRRAMARLKRKASISAVTPAMVLWIVRRNNEMG